ncbi:MAG: molybdopterin-synthase adenylyltransferase MoeB [Helicobacteraceae bacterium]|jgi:adenylyltransferase/sulfurtransferase|nr:molybdopterin-synthase adenylyltransferase MoeB [Helicobacteraceae bacterium]
MVESILSNRALEELTHDEIARYSRHLLLDEVGLEGQQRLKSSRVLIVGTGGLGAPLGLYLAAAGVGTIGLVDFDTVEASNLQRQIIHSTRDLDRPKVASAKDRIRSLNPFVKVVVHQTHLTSQNALDIIGDYDIVADGTDNFQTRYLVNDACVILGIPNVYGSIFQFEGQASVFYAKGGPCYRCLYPAPPPLGLVPSCGEAGVIGVLPGIIGTIQANEVIKLILGSPKGADNEAESLVGRLLLFDAWKLRFREFKIKKNESCPVCGKHPTINELIDYDQFCGVPKPRQTPIATIAPKELKARLDRGEKVQMIDVRDPHELKIVHIDGAKSIPLFEIVDRKDELNATGDVVVICKVGERSAAAIEALQEARYRGKLLNLEGGIRAWVKDIDPTLATY